MFGFLKNLTSFFAWLQIMVSPCLLGALLGATAWWVIQDRPGVIVAGVCTVGGIGLGVWWAEKARRGKGTVEFMARTRRHPELQDKHPTQ